MDKREAIKFFYTLYKDCQGFIELRPFTRKYKPYFKGRRWIPTGFPKALVDEAWNLRNRYHLFFGVATRRKESKIKKKAGKEYIQELPALYADLDFADYQEGRKEAEEIIDDFPFSPTIISSGHGYHLYYLLDKPIRVSRQNIFKIERILKVLQDKLLLADPTHDISRVLRVPGSYNWKEVKNPKLVRIEKFSDKRYSVQDFVDQFSPWLNQPKSKSCKANRGPTQPVKRKGGKIQLESLNIPRRIKKLIREGKSDQDRYPSRSEADQAVITCLIANHYPEEVILEIFKQYPNGIGEKFYEKGSSGEKYLKHSIRSAKEYLARKKIED